MNSILLQKEITVGVDTGKFELDIHIRPLDIYFTVSNTPEGVKEAIKIIKKHKPTRIVIEATGRLEHEFIFACSKANLPFVVANPTHVRKFAGAVGQLAKTDKLDAAIIAHYGEAIQPKLSTLKAEEMRLMSDLLTRRRQLIDMQTMEKNRLQIMPKDITGLIKPLLTALKNLIIKVEDKLMKLIKQCEDYHERNSIIQSMPGVGNILAFTLLSDLPELGYMTNKQASALVGVAPINNESGSYKGRRQVRGGRPKVRSVMFMAMMSAIQCNPIFKAKFNSLVASGKPKKVAIVACMRKMIVILNSMVRDGAHWDPKTI